MSENNSLYDLLCLESDFRETIDWIQTPPEFELDWENSIRDIREGLLRWLSIVKLSEETMEEIESGCIPESNFMRQHHYQKSLDGLRLCAAAAAMNEGWRMLVPLIDAVPATVVWQAEYALQIRKMSSNLICPVNGEGGYDSVYDEDVRAYVKKSTKSFKQLSSFWKVVQVEHDKFQGYPNANDGELGNLRSKHMDGSELDATKYSNGDEGLRRDALIYLRASQGRENKQIVDELERTAAIEKWDPVRSDYVHKRIKAFCNFTGRPMPKTRRNRSSKGSD